MKNEFDFQKDESPDIKIFLRKLLTFWPLVLLGVLVGTASAYLINRYTLPIYKAEIKLLIDDGKDKGSMGAEQFMSALGYYNPRLTFENEVIKIKSRTLTEKTLDNLDFEVSYFTKGRILTQEVYGDKVPIHVIYDSIPEFMEGALLELEITDKSSWKLVNISELSQIWAFPLEENYPFGRPIQWGTFFFQINSTKGLKGGEKLAVRFNTRHSLIRQFNEALIVGPEAKGASAIRMELSGKNQQKIVDYLDELAKTYIEFGLAEARERSEKTLDFINGQLSIITDSLNVAENLRERFRSENRITTMSEEGGRIFNKLDALITQKSIEDLQMRYLRYLEEYVEGKRLIDDIVAPSAMGVQDPLLISLVTELIGLNAERQKLQSGIKQQGSVLNTIDAQINLLKKTLKENLKSQKKSGQ
ncbi:MAG: GumC domain-containing protein, partial [Bacteroidia bacterium]